MTVASPSAFAGPQQYLELQSRWRTVEILFWLCALLPFVVAQVVGAILGVWLAHLMFDLPILQASTKVRSGIGQWAAEATATFGLVLLILLGVRKQAAALPAAVAVYIVGAYWFTASTSFANPAVTIARSLSNTFAGILPADAPAFILAQVIGTAAALLAAKFLEPAPTA